MLKNQDVYLKLQSLMKQFNLNIEIYIERKSPLNRRIGGKYNSGDHSITLYLEEIQEQCQWMFGSQKNVQDYASVIFAHEAGHASDPYLQKLVELYDEAKDDLKKSKIELLIEVQAWKIARAIVKDVPAAFFNTIKRCSLEHHYQAVSEHMEDISVA